MCYQVQAKMFRFVSGTTLTYLGSLSTTYTDSSGHLNAAYSIVERSAGTNSGNYLRARANAPSLMTDWTWYGYTVSRSSETAQTLIPAAATPSEEEYARARSQAVSPAQRRALQDSEVSLQEYAAAYDAYAACLTSAGWASSPIEMSDGVLGMEIRGRAEGNKFENVNNACRAETVDYLETLYLAVADIDRAAQ
ncbi:hypothetical protein BOH66_02660 [Microbacterium aurum]|uniref:Uncharacterized protein n=1 Tax=Microbacterium aurum TaxID=36805 RepID=A0A1P8U5D4_9MICO|nr:hypothetical protein BOH66_02660 [Microbacterium aurum]